MHTLSTYMLCSTHSLGALVKKEALHIINHCFYGSSCTDVKDGTNDPTRNRVYCCWKTRPLLAKLPLQRRWEADNYSNIAVQRKVLLQALVESDKSPLIFSQETIAEIFLQVMTSQVTFKLKYGLMIFYEITNRCNHMQSILFHC